MSGYRVSVPDIESAAFELFFKQAREYEISRPRAETEWAGDMDLRLFWIDQVLTVVEHLDGRNKIEWDEVSE